VQQHPRAPPADLGDEAPELRGEVGGRPGEDQRAAPPTVRPPGAQAREVLEQDGFGGAPRDELGVVDEDEDVAAAGEQGPFQRGAVRAVGDRQPPPPLRGER
jgi:hypothetical protein